MSIDTEHQFDQTIKELYEAGWTGKKIAKHIGRSETYVAHRVGIKDPLGPDAVDPGPPTEQRILRQFNSHKPGGW